MTGAAVSATSIAFGYGANALRERCACREAPKALIEIRREQRGLNLVHEGLPVRQTNAADPDLMISVRSKSHLELQAAEFDAITSKL